jgi:hypothetical protein
MDETRETMLQDLALKLDLANMELQTIDEVLARRPALAGLKHRTEKIEHACAVNSLLLEALTKLQWTTAGVMTQMEGCQPTEMIGAIFDGREIELAKQALIEAEAAIRKAKGE